METSTQTTETAERKIYPSQLDPYKRRQYYDRFYAKKQELGSITCPICFGKYTYFNKYHHNKGVHHLRAVEEKNRQKQLTDTIKTLDKLFSLEELGKLPPTSATPSCCSVVGDE
jgi:hypothetical protein